MLDVLCRAHSNRKVSRSCFSETMRWQSRSAGFYKDLNIRQPPFFGLVEIRERQIQRGEQGIVSFKHDVASKLAARPSGGSQFEHFKEILMACGLSCWSSSFSLFSRKSETHGFSERTVNLTFCVACPRMQRVTPEHSCVLFQARAHRFSRSGLLGLYDRPGGLAPP